MPAVRTHTMCVEGGCDRTDKLSRGLCGMHYKRHRNAGTLPPCIQPRRKEMLRAAGYMGDGSYTHEEYKLFVNYGLRLGQYDEMLTAQNGVCAICGGVNKSGKRLAVDHCHETGEVRGLLCTNCNTAIGKLGHDQALLRAAIQYLGG